MLILISFRDQQSSKMAKTCIKAANMALFEGKISAANTELNALINTTTNASAKANATESLTADAMANATEKETTNAGSHATENATVLRRCMAMTFAIANACPVKIYADSMFPMLCALFTMNLWTLNGLL